jgi:hypothetical protein
MVNNRLMWYLESNNISTAVQSGFRNSHSTTDQLVQFEAFVREDFVRREHVVSVFFNLAKAYDTTWKPSILQDLHDAGLRGQMSDIISQFLSNRLFRVRVGSHLSDVYQQEMGVPQSSILSVTLFILKMNLIVQCLPPGVCSSLYVDDFICYCASQMASIERQLQLRLNKLQNWADTNGFQFFKSKTVCVHFCQ